jgi:hypothetical protein
VTRLSACFRVAPSGSSAPHFSRVHGGDRLRGVQITRKIGRNHELVALVGKRSDIYAERDARATSDWLYGASAAGPVYQIAALRKHVSTVSQT